MATNQEMVERIKTLAGAIDETFLELGRILKTLQDSNQEDFNAAIASSGLGRRKAYYLVAIDRVFSRIPAPKPRLQKIGWTKLALLTTRIDKTNFAEMLRAAERHTAKELEAWLAGERPEGKKRAFLAYLDSESYEVLEIAFARVGGVKHQRGYSNKGAALSALVRIVANLPQEVFDQYGVMAKDDKD